MPDQPDIYRQFFACAPDLLCVAGLDGRFRQVNPSWTRVLGWSEAELLARPWLDFVHPDDRADTLAAGENLLRGRQVQDFINRYRCKDGSWRNLSWHSHPVPGDAGLIMAVVRDVTETEAMRRDLDQTRQQLAAVLELSPLGLHLWEVRGDDLVLAMSNPAADRFTAVDTKTLIGRRIEEAFPQTVPLGLPRRYTDVALGREPPFKLDSLPYCDGRICGHFDVWLFQAGHGRAAAFFIEVTERLRQERELLASREDLRITLDSIGDGVIACDREGRVTRINRVAQQLTGRSEADAIGRPVDQVFAIVNADTGRRVESPVTRVLREGQVVGLANHTALMRPDGSRVQIADSGAPIRDQQGGISGVVLVFRDVTEEHALQRQLHQAQKMEAVGQLAGGIAHDFNNLLGGVLGAAELLSRALPPDERTRRWLDMISSSATRAAELTQKLLAFGRKSQAQVLPIDLPALLHQVAGILEHTIDRRIALRLDLPQQPVRMRGDPSQVQSAILNLALNARDALASGGTLRISLAAADLAAVPPCRHTLGMITPGPHAAIAVSDDGCGIPGELIERIFDPFFTTKGPGEGSGLGLASVWTAAKDHGGAVTVDSNPGKGSTFTLYLPLAVEDNHPATPTPRQALPSLRGSRILVIDDEPAIRAAVVEWLADEGYVVGSAGDGDAALALPTTPPPDLVILDLVMPGRPASEVFKLLKQRHPGVPILLMSGYNLHGAKADGLLAEGAAGFLQKPFRFEDLGAAIQRLLRAQH